MAAKQVSHLTRCDRNAQSLRFEERTRSLKSFFTEKFLNEYRVKDEDLKSSAMLGLSTGNYQRFEGL